MNKGQFVLAITLGCLSVIILTTGCATSSGTRKITPSNPLIIDGSPEAGGTPPVEPTYTPPSVATPEPEPSTEPSQTSRTNPAGLHQVVRVDIDNWLDGKVIMELGMLEIISGDEAWNIIYAWNQFNDEPKAGKEYILVKFRVKIVESEEEPYDINDAQFVAYSATGVEYTDFYSVAGKDPDLSANLFEGAEHIGYTAFIVESSDSPVAVYDLRWDENAMWFDLRSN